MNSKPVLLSLIFLFLQTQAFPADSGEIKYIKDAYKKVSDKIENNTLFVTKYEAKLRPIPIMGIPYTSAVFYFNMLGADNEKDEGRYSLLKSEYYYEFGYVHYEEFLYDTGGKVLFYYYKRGNGTIAKIATIKWDKEERYYFKGEKLLRVIIDGKTNDSPGEKAVKKGKYVLMQGKTMNELAEKISISPLQSELLNP